MNRFAALVFTFFFSACATGPRTDLRHPSAAGIAELLGPGESLLADGLPGNEEDRAVLEFHERLDLENAANVLKLASGGSSCYLKVKGPDARYPAGAFLTENEATHTETEVAAYQIARWLGVSDTFGPGRPYEAGPRVAAAYAKLIRDAIAANALSCSRLNADVILKRLKQRPDGITGIYKPFGPRPFDCDDLNGGTFSANGGTVSTPNPNAQLHAYLKASGPQPDERPINLECIRKEMGSTKRSARLSDLSRQLSSIYLVDALTGQWDRFSGGNLQVVEVGADSYRFVSYDNGGADITGEWIFTEKLQLGVLERFDPKVLVRLEALQRELSPTLMTSLGVRAEHQAAFAKRLDAVLKHIASLRKRYGRGISFAG